jgi:hypothetical protein
LGQQQFSHRASLTVLPTLYLHSKYHAKRSTVSSIPILLKSQCKKGYKLKHTEFFESIRTKGGFYAICSIH